MNADAREDIVRWLEEGQRLFRTWSERVEMLDRLQLTLERDKEELHREIVRLQHDNEVLRAQREELLAAFNNLAGNVTQVADEILQRFRGDSRQGDPHRT